MFFRHKHEWSDWQEIPRELTFSFAGPLMITGREIDRYRWCKCGKSESEQRGEYDYSRRDYSIYE